MKLTNLHIDEFGALSDLSLDHLPSGFSGVYGPNGSGKSTLLYFLRGAMGDKSDAAAASLWQQTDRHCGTIGVRSASGASSEPVTIRGGMKTKRELLENSAAARLSTMVATESIDSESLLGLADRLGLDAVSDSRDRAAEEAYEAKKLALEAQIQETGEALAEANAKRGPLVDRIRRRQADWQHNYDRLTQQRRDVMAAVRSADEVTAARHADYQVAQSDLTEWQTDAWRPRRVETRSRQVNVPALSRPVPMSSGSIESALQEIARLRCQATTRLNDGYVREADRCGTCDDADQARLQLDHIRRRLDEGCDVDHLSAELHELGQMLDRHEETVAWLRADRAIALLDRCQRDLLRVRGTLAESVCGATPTVIEATTKTIREEFVESPADADLGRSLRDRKDLTERQWHAAMRQGIQVRRHLARIDAEIATLGLLDIAALEAELDALDAEIAHLTSKRAALVVDLENLVRPVTRGPNPIMAAASDYFRRMTCGNYRGLTLKDRKRTTPRLMAVSMNDHAIDARTLSRGTHGQATLALRLAMLDAVHENDDRWPLVLDDAMVDSDFDRMLAGVEVLEEWSKARGGRQVLLLTCQRQLIEALHKHDIPLMALPGGQPLLDALNSDQLVTTTVEPRRGTKPVTFRKTTPIATTTTTTTAPSTPASDIASITFDASAVSTTPPKYWLSGESLIADVPSIDGVTARRLQTLGMSTIADLRAADATLLEGELIRLQISPDWFRRWQSEAVLLASVSELSARDAQLLAYIGILDAEMLSGLTVEELNSRIVTARNRGGSNRPSLDWDGLSSHRISGWIERASRSTRGTRRHLKVDRSTQRRGRRFDGDRSLSVIERRRSERSGSARTSVASESETTLKHYLHKSSPVVDAPSIGPKMAKRLGKCGIKTVGDLLKANANAVAKKLDDRRINASTVTDWIDQSRLLVRVPQLRGHDAQVLVACGFRSLEELQQKSATAVFAKVGPFVESKDGQRLLRSSRTPDLAEVTDWLDWAQHARPLKAA